MTPSRRPQHRRRFELAPDAAAPAAARSTPVMTCNGRFGTARPLPPRAWRPRAPALRQDRARIVRWTDSLLLSVVACPCWAAQAAGRWGALPRGNAFGSPASRRLGAQAAGAMARAVRPLARTWCSPAADLSPARGPLIRWPGAAQGVRAGWPVWVTASPWSTSPTSCGGCRCAAGARPEF